MFVYNVHRQSPHLFFSCAYHILNYEKNSFDAGCINYAACLWLHYFQFRYLNNQAGILQYFLIEFRPLNSFLPWIVSAPKIQLIKKNWSIAAIDWNGYNFQIEKIIVSAETSYMRIYGILTKCRPCHLSRFYLDFIQILSKFYLDFTLILS